MSVLRVKAYQATITILYILPLIPIWYYDYLPIRDYPRHLAGIKVLRDYHSDSLLQENLSVKFFQGISPIPNIAFELFATKICSFCDINKAGKLFISSYVLLFILSLYLLSRELKVKYADVLLMTLPLVYSTYLYMGFMNFIFSIPIFLLSVWSYLSAKRKRGYLIALGITSVLTYISHLFAFLSLLIFLFVDIAMSFRILNMKFILSTVASISLPLLLSINYLLLSSGTPGYYHPEGILYKIAILAYPFIYFSLSIGIAMFIFYIYSLLFIFYGSLLINKVVFAVSISYLLLFLALPFETIEGKFVDVRAIAFCMVMLPFSVKLDGNRYKRGIFAMIVLSALLNTTVAWASFSRFNEEMSEGLNCLKKVDDKVRLLPIAEVTEEKVYGPFGLYFFGAPYAHAWGYAFLDKSFITPYFSSNVHHILKYKTELYTPPAGWHLTEDGKASLPWEGIKTTL